MIEGFKLIVYRIIFLVFTILGIMPVYRYIYNYALGTDPTYCASALPMINTGVGMIYSIGFIGIALAALQMYYRAVRQRQYESTYYGDGMMNAYMR